MEIKYTINIMHLNNPETIPPTICGKIVFHNASPWCPKDWGSLPYNIPFSVDVLVTNSLGFCLSLFPLVMEACFHCIRISSLVIFFPCLELIIPLSLLSVFKSQLLALSLVFAPLKAICLLLSAVSTSLANFYLFFSSLSFVFINFPGLGCAFLLVYPVQSL